MCIRDSNKSGRNAAVVKMKLKNLLTGAASEAVYKADDKFEQVVLDKKEVTYSYFADPMYVFVDADSVSYTHLDVYKRQASKLSRESRPVRQL